MKTGILLKRSLAILCMMFLMISLLTVPAFAHEEETSAPTTPPTTTTEKKGLEPTAIVFICIGGVLVVAGVVLGIKYREKVVKFLRVYKSEAKKVVWLSWDQTKKSTLVVLVVLVIAGALICLVDLGLSKGLIGFLGLFKK